MGWPAPGAGALRLRRRAQAISDYVKIYTPANIRAMLDSLKSSYDVANRNAQGQADWDIHYAEFLKFYKTTNEAWGITYSQDTVDQIRQRERELGLWQQRLQARGIDAGPTRSPDTDNTTRDATKLLQTLVKVAAVGGGLYLVAKVIR